MKLIAASGTNRTEWALIEDGRLMEQVVTEGFNPYFQTRREISRSIRVSLPASFFKVKLKNVYYYGVGCCFPEKRKIVLSSLMAQFKTSVSVESNSLGTARALFLRKPGLACLIENGANSCLYDGERIIDQLSSCGYILSDDGSGSYLAKAFLSDLLKRKVPDDLMDSFVIETQTELSYILDKLYRAPHPNRYLEETAAFLASHKHHPYVEELVLNGFRRFFERNICCYADYKRHPLRVAGAVAHTYAPLLRRVAREYHKSVRTVQESILNGLVEYHSLYG